MIIKHYGYDLISIGSVSSELGCSIGFILLHLMIFLILNDSD